MSAWDEIRAEAETIIELQRDVEYAGGVALASMLLEIPAACRPTEFTYTTLPDDDVNATVWRVKAEWRGPGDRWAITRLGYCLSVRGKWDLEPMPSSRTEKFKLHHRFTLAEAIERLPAALDTVIINGMKLKDGVLVNSDTEEPIHAPR